MKKWEEQRKLLIHKKKLKAAKPVVRTTQYGLFIISFLLKYSNSRYYGAYYFTF